MIHQIRSPPTTQDDPRGLGFGIGGFASHRWKRARPPGALTARLCSCLANRAAKAQRSASETVAHSTGVLKIPRLHIRSVCSYFQNRPFSTVEKLPPITDCCIDLFSEEDVFQGNEKAGSGKPDGRDPPGTPQSAGCGKGTATSFTGR